MIPIEIKIKNNVYDILFFAILYMYFNKQI